MRIILPLRRRTVDAGNIEALLRTATALGLERLLTGCTQYLLSRDVLTAAPAQVAASATLLREKLAGQSCCTQEHASAFLRSALRAMVAGCKPPAHLSKRGPAGSGGAAA